MTWAKRRDSLLMIGTTSSPPRHGQRAVRAEVVLDVDDEQHAVLGRRGRAVPRAGSALSCGMMVGGVVSTADGDAPGHVLLGVAERLLGASEGLDQFVVGLEAVLGPLGHHPGDEFCDRRRGRGRAAAPGRPPRPA